jgi:hypothetical protein
VCAVPFMTHHRKADKCDEGEVDDDNEAGAIRATGVLPGTLTVATTRRKTTFVDHALETGAEEVTSKGPPGARKCGQPRPK